MSSANPVKPQGSPARHPVAMVEDRHEVREQWVRLLESFEEFHCPCACGSGEEALANIPEFNPEIVLMDIFMPGGMSGIECTARLKKLLPATRILILTASDDEELVFPALEAGADGYLLKHTTPADLRTALLDILAGGVPMTSGIARRVAEYFRKRAHNRDEIHRLSPREKEILESLSKGYSNKEIADKLNLSVETIRSYLKNVYEKMHVRSRAEAVAKYMGDSES